MFYLFKTHIIKKNKEVNVLLSGILYFLAGLGILLYGVSTMSSALEKLMGASVRKKINKFSKNRFQIFGLGFFSSIVLQSSTATTVMAVGFTGAGIITLFQSIGFILGSNVGTTLTALLFSVKGFNIIEILSILVLVGVILNSAFKSPKVKQVGMALIGFGLLFCGMVLLNSATTIFKGIEGFEGIISGITNPIVLILLGIFISVITQSSLGAIALLVSFAGTGNVITLYSASFVIYGANIGTCLTALVASIKSNADGKRAGLFHLLFNIFGTILFSLINLTGWLNIFSGMDVSFSIILVNIIVKAVTAILVLPFVKSISNFMKIFFKEKRQDSKYFVLDSNVLMIPTMALKQVNLGVTDSFVELKNQLFSLKEILFNPSNKGIESTAQHIKFLQKNASSISLNAVKISGETSENDQANIACVHNTVNNYNLVLKDCLDILDGLTIEDKFVSLTKTQTATIEQLFSETINIVNGFHRIFNHIYAEDFEFNYSASYMAILECTTFVTEIKNKQKVKLLENTKSQKQIEKYSAYLNIVNQLDEMANRLTDMLVNVSEFTSLVQKGEDYETNN